MDRYLVKLSRALTSSRLKPHPCEKQVKLLHLSTQQKRMSTFMLLEH